MGSRLLEERQPKELRVMADELQGMRIAFLVANEGVEQVELTEPMKAYLRRAYDWLSQ